MVSSRNGEVYSKNSFTLKSYDKNKKSDMGKSNVYSFNSS